MCAVGWYIKQVFKEVNTHSLPDLTDINVLAESAHDSVIMAFKEVQSKWFMTLILLLVLRLKCCLDEIAGVTATRCTLKRSQCEVIG